MPRTVESCATHTVSSGHVSRADIEAQIVQNCINDYHQGCRLVERIHSKAGMVARIMAPQRCPHPNPRNLLMCLPYMAKWTCKCLSKLRILRWDGYAGLSSWAPCNHRSPVGGRREGQRQCRKWDNRNKRLECSEGQVTSWGDAAASRS